MKTALVMPLVAIACIAALSACTSPAPTPTLDSQTEQAIAMFDSARLEMPAAEWPKLEYVDVATKDCELPDGSDGVTHHVTQAAPVLETDDYDAENADTTVAANLSDVKAAWDKWNTYPPIENEISSIARVVVYKDASGLSVVFSMAFNRPILEADTGCFAE